MQRTPSRVHPSLWSSVFRCLIKIPYCHEARSKSASKSVWTIKFCLKGNFTIMFTMLVKIRIRAPEQDHHRRSEPKTLVLRSLDALHAQSCMTAGSSRADAESRASQVAQADHCGHWIRRISYSNREVYWNSNRGHLPIGPPISKLYFNSCSLHLPGGQFLQLVRGQASDSVQQQPQNMHATQGGQGKKDAQATNGWRALGGRHCAFPPQTPSSFSVHKLEILPAVGIAGPLLGMVESSRDVGSF